MRSPDRLPALALLALAAASCASPPGPPPGPSRVPEGPASPEAPGGGDDRPVLDLSLHPAPEPPPPDPRGLFPEGEDPVLATVDGEAIRGSAVARTLFRYDPARGLEILGQILDARIVEADAAARGIVLPPGVVEALAEQEVRRKEAEIRVQYGAGTTLEGYLGERFGIPLADYRRDTEALVRLQALRDRLVRYEALREDRIRIRVLVLADEGAARDAARRLREGADFVALARQVSLAPADDLPSYRREDVRPGALADELFAMAPGEISRPVRVARDGREVYEVFKVVERLAARDLPWSAAAEEVERGLKARPLATREYLQWARRARERHAVAILLAEPAAEPR